MSWLKRLFDGRYRQARAAEGAGEWRRAAGIWAEAGDMGRAADCLLHLAERSTSLDDRLEAFHDALRFVPEDDERRADVERRMGMAVLEDARNRGAASAEEKRRLSDAAARLERSGRPLEAAEAFAMLGRTEDQARCLEAAGDVEKLEALLDTTGDKDERASKLRRLLADYEMALRYGARLEARTALREAAKIAEGERSVAELLRRLESRLPPPSRVAMSIDGKRVRFIGRLPAVLGRGEVEIPVRGTSVSREHAEIALAQSGFVVRDLDSKNGTLVRGLPIAGSIELSGDTEIGLGDDVTLAVKAREGSVIIDVMSGLDRGERIVIGNTELRIDGLPAAVRFVEGWAIVAADRGAELQLDGQSCALPVHVLLGDRFVCGGVVVEVLE